MPKFTWIESFRTITKYSAEITQEEAEMFENDEERFFEEVQFRDVQELEWDKITDEYEGDYEIE